MCYSVSSLSSCLKTSFGCFRRMRHTAIVADRRTKEALPRLRLRSDGPKPKPRQAPGTTKGRVGPCPLCEFQIFGAEKRTRTSTPLRERGPEPRASANSAISAHCNERETRTAGESLVFQTRGGLSIHTSLPYTVRTGCGAGFASRRPERNHDRDCEDACYCPYRPDS